MSKLLKLLGLTLILVVLLPFPASLFAKGPGDVQLGITPLEYPGAYFDLKMSAGETRSLKVEVGNHGSEPIAARTYAADAYTIINGGFGARLDGEPASGTTLWLDYPALTINLPAGDAVQRSFTLTVPPGTKPGEYITSLVVQNAEPVASEGGSVALLQIQRKAIAVAIAVANPLPPAAPIDGAQSQDSANRGLFLRNPTLAVGKSEHKYVASSSVVTVDLANQGNVHLRPSGEFLLFDDAGQEISRFHVVMDTVYTGTSTKVEVPFTKALLPGKYVVHLKLDYEGGTVDANQITLEIPRPTKAESQGAPTGADGRAIADQRAPSGLRSLPFSVLILMGAIGALSPILVYAIVRRLWPRR